MAFDIFGDDLTETQRCILRQYDRNPDITPRAIASNCNCSASYVREVLNKHRSGFVL